MKYLLCYSYGEEVKEEVFGDFAKAVSRYTLMCSKRREVVLADLEECRIIRQFSHRSGNGDSSDVVYIH